MTFIDRLTSEINNMFMSEQIKRVEKRLRDLGWSRADLARQLDMSEQRVSNWWYRGSIPKDVIERISRILDCSIDWLVSGISTAKQPTDHQLNDHSPSVYPTPEIDRELLAAIITSVELASTMRQAALTARQKAAAIAGSYKISAEDGRTAETFDRKVVEAAIETSKGQTSPQ